MQKVWSQVPRSSKCVSEGKLETRRGARASVKVEKKKKKKRQQQSAWAQGDSGKGHLGGIFTMKNSHQGWGMLGLMAIDMTLIEEY